MKILSQPAGGTPTPAGRTDLYKDGVSYVSFDNASGYSVTGETMVQSVFGATHISMVNGASDVTVIGTVLPVDLTDIAAVHVVAKRNSGNANGMMVDVGTTKVVENYAARINVATSGDAEYADYVLDVSALTGSHYVYMNSTSYSMDVDVKEIYLTEQ